MHKNAHNLFASEKCPQLHDNHGRPARDNQVAGCLLLIFFGFSRSQYFYLHLDLQAYSQSHPYLPSFSPFSAFEPGRVTYLLSSMFSALQNPRHAASQIISFGLILSTAFMMWKGLSVIADSPSPIVVVLSGSMEPAFQRGDLLFLWNRNWLEETKVGEIVVYNVKGKDIPIVHRVVRKFGTGYVIFLAQIQQVIHQKSR